MDELDVYLQNHWAAAAGGHDLARRVLHTHRGTDLDGPLAEVTDGVAEDREALRDLMHRLGLRPGVLGPLTARVAERVGRLKPNGHLVRRSPVSDVLELEALRGAVSAKLAGWDVLLVLADQVPNLPAEDVQRLRQRADEQLDVLAEVHRTLAARRLATDGA